MKRDETRGADGVKSMKKRSLKASDKENEEMKTKNLKDLYSFALRIFSRCIQNDFQSGKVTIRRADETKNNMKGVIVMENNFEVKKSANVKTRATALKNELSMNKSWTAELCCQTRSTNQKSTIMALISWRDDQDQHWIKIFTKSQIWA